MRRAVGGQNADSRSRAFPSYPVSFSNSSIRKQYEFEYEEDSGNDGEGEVDVENSYYTAKCESPGLGERVDES